MSRSGIVLGGLALAIILAGMAGVGSYYSSEDSPDNTAPDGICEKHGFKTNDDPTKVTIGPGDTVSTKAIEPLMTALSISLEEATEMIKDANPKVLNLDKVAENAIINVPNCIVPG